MAIVYDLKLTSGNRIEGCHFVLYEKPIYSGSRSLITYVPESLRCFIKDKEQLNVDIINAKIEKIYDDETNEDLTNKISEHHEKVVRLLGEYRPLQFHREVVRLK